MLTLLPHWTMQLRTHLPALCIPTEYSRESVLIEWISNSITFKSRKIRVFSSTNTFPLRTLKYPTVTLPIIVHFSPVNWHLDQESDFLVISVWLILSQHQVHSRLSKGSFLMPDIWNPSLNLFPWFPSRLSISIKCHYELTFFAVSY